MGDARNHSGGGAVHAVLRHSLSDGRDADHGDESVGVIAWFTATDLRLRDIPLSLDGCGPDLQARHGVHLGGSGNRGSLFCGGCGRRGIGARSRAQFRPSRHDPGNRGDRSAI